MFKFLPIAIGINPQCSIQCPQVNGIGLRLVNAVAVF